MKNSTGFMFYLAGLSVLGFLATDMYLPAFGAMQQDLATSAGTISASLSIFLAGFALGQPLWGVLSDRLGRKPVLLLGLLMFAAGCLGMLWAHNDWQLWSLRFIQAIGVCSASVTWQALVVDRYEASQAKRVFATIMPLVALSPALAPLMGAGVLEHLGWRAIFAVLTLITLALLLPTLLLKPSKKIDSHSAKKPSLGFYQLLGTRVYSGNVMMYAACSAGFFAWLTGSPFILGDMGYSPSDIGLSYVPQTLAFLIGGMGCRSALSRVDGKVMLPWLLLIYSVSMIAIYMVATLTTPTLTTLMIPFCAMAFANGASYPIMVSSALTPFPESTGKAAALQNSLQLGLCFVASMVVSAYVSQPLLATATVMLSTVVLALLGYYLQWHNRSTVQEQSISNVS